MSEKTTLLSGAETEFTAFMRALAGLVEAGEGLLQGLQLRLGLGEECRLLGHDRLHGENVGM